LSHNFVYPRQKGKEDPKRRKKNPNMFCFIINHFYILTQKFHSPIRGVEKSMTQVRQNWNQIIGELAEWDKLGKAILK